jgi:hypothetical protein
MPTAKQEALLKKLQKIDEELRKAEELKKTHPIFFFKPIGNQYKFFESRARNRYVFGSNRSGKSVIGTVELIACAMGYRPWLPEDHPDYWVRMGTGEKIPVPNVGFHLVENLNTSGKMIFLKKMEEWLPREWGRVKVNSYGQPVSVHFTNGSVCHVYSQNMDIDSLEGPNGHYFSCDEPPKQTYWNAIKRGLVDFDGIAWITATPLKASHFMAELMKEASGDKEGKHHQLISLSIHDNRKSRGGHLPDEAVDAFIDSLPADEIESRVYGRPKHLAGAVYKKWMDAPPYCIDPFDIPPDWPRIMCFDPAEQKPMAAVWIAISPDNKWYIYRDLYESSLITTKHVADWVKQAEGWTQRDDGTWFQGPNAEPVVMRLIDTSGNKLERTSGATVAQGLGEEGIYCCNAFKGNFAGGIDRVKKMLDFEPQYEWDTGPQMVTFNTCLRVRHEFMNYIFAPQSSQARATGADPSGKPLATNDDCMDCVRYLAVTQATYSGLMSLMKQLGFDRWV